jgi:hypothetical protein
LNKNIPEILRKKIHLDNEELSAYRIIKVWEGLDKKSISKSNNWFIFKILLKTIGFKKIAGSVLRKLFPRKFTTTKDKKKFTPFDKKNINERVDKLRALLRIDEKITCTVLSDRTILIRKL